MISYRDKGRYRAVIFSTLFVFSHSIMALDNSSIGTGITVHTTNSSTLESITVRVPIGKGFEPEYQAYRAGVVALKIKGAALLTSNITAEFKASNTSYEETVKIYALSLVQLTSISSRTLDDVLYLTASVNVDNASAIAKANRVKSKKQYETKIEEYEALKSMMDKGIEVNNWTKKAKLLTRNSHYAVNTTMLKLKSEVAIMTDEVKSEISIQKNKKLNELINKKLIEYPLMEVTDVDLCKPGWTVKGVPKNNTFDIFLDEWEGFYTEKRRRSLSRMYNSWDGDYIPRDSYKDPYHFKGYQCIDVTMQLNKANAKHIGSIVGVSLFEIKASLKYSLLASVTNIDTFNARKVILGSGYSRDDYKIDYVTKTDEGRREILGYSSFFTMKFGSRKGKITYTMETGDADLSRYPYVNENFSIENNKNYRCYDNATYYKPDVSSCDYKFVAKRILPMISSFLKRKDYFSKEKNNPEIFIRRVFYDAESLELKNVSIKSVASN